MAEFTFAEPEIDPGFLQYEVHRLPNGVLATCVQWAPDQLEWSPDHHQKHSEDFAATLRRVAEAADERGPITSWKLLAGLSYEIANATRRRSSQWRERLFMHGYGFVVVAQAETRDDPTINPYIDYEVSGNVGVAVTGSPRQPEAKYIKEYVDDPRAYLGVSSSNNFPIGLPSTVYLGSSSAIVALEENGFTGDADTRARLGSLTLTAN